MNVKSLIPINVTKEEIEKIQLELCKWATPQAFARAEDIHRSKFSSSQYFKQPGLNFMMESYVASVVAEVAQYDAVRLSCPPEQAPDFYLRMGNVELAVEVGEALETGRKRGDEKWDDFELVFDPASKWLERADQIQASLITQSNTNSKKNMR